MMMLVILAAVLVVVALRQRHRRVPRHVQASGGVTLVADVQSRSQR
jgi:hypothetical protein